jgi:hypothetical protein
VLHWQLGIHLQTVTFQLKILCLVFAATAALPMLAASPDNLPNTAAPSTAIIEHIALRNGSEMTCVAHQSTGDRVRLYVSPGNYVEVASTLVVNIEIVPAPQQEIHATASQPSPTSLSTLSSAPFTQPFTHASLHPLLAEAGTAHNIDSDLLWSIVKAESSGNPHAVSRAGARGLMQLMPATAATLGVADSFAPEENISGGAAYLDMLLTRYHDNITLALAAYNAGPEAVDRYHGIPPYRETRIYVARVIAEFNSRKRALKNSIANNIARDQIQTAQTSN